MKKLIGLLGLLTLTMRQSMTQGFIEYGLTLDGQHAIPPNGSQRTATAAGRLYDYGSFGATVYLVDYRNVTSVSLFESMSPNTLGAQLFDLPLSSYYPGINGSPGAQSWSYSAILGPTDIARLRAGDWWLVVSSTDYPNGELRGQITSVPEPSSLALLGVGALGLWALRRRTKKDTVEPQKNS